MDSAWVAAIASAGSCMVGGLALTWGVYRYLDSKIERRDQKISQQVADLHARIDATAGREDLHREIGRVIDAVERQGDRLDQVNLQIIQTLAAIVQTHAPGNRHRGGD